MRAMPADIAWMLKSDLAKGHFIASRIFFLKLFDAAAIVNQPPESHVGNLAHGPVPPIRIASRRET